MITYKMNLEKGSISSRVPKDQEVNLAMTSSRAKLLVFSLFLSMVITSYGQNCSDYVFVESRVYKSCIDLKVLDAHLHWNYIPSTGWVDIAYRANQTSNGWVAWAVNPNGSGMLGSQALVAFQHPNGSLVAYPTPIESFTPLMQPGTLSYQVSNISAKYDDNELTIFAMMGPFANGTTTINHVWQAGPVWEGIPQMHEMSGPNIESMGTINFLSR